MSIQVGNLNVAASASAEQARRERVFAQIEREAIRIVGQLVSVSPQHQQDWLAQQVREFTPRVAGQHQVNVAFTLGMCVGSKLHALVGDDE